jgi:hypothetical protein
MIKSFVEITIKAMKWGCFLREDPIFLYAGHATDLCPAAGALFKSGHRGREVALRFGRWPHLYCLIAAQPPPLQKSTVAGNTDKTRKKRGSANVKWKYG